jgi:hypothetical protein
MAVADLCEILNQLQVKAHNAKVSTNTTAIGLQNSIAGEQHCSLKELKLIAINWVDIEDQLGIVDAVVDKEMKILERKLLSKKMTNNQGGDSASDSSICSSSSCDNDSGAPEQQPKKLEPAKLSVLEMEAMLKRIRASAVERGVWNEAKKHLEVDEFMRIVRRGAMKKTSAGRQQSIHGFFNKAPPKEPGQPAKKKAKYQEEGAMCVPAAVTINICSLGEECNWTVMDLFKCNRKGCIFKTHHLCASEKGFHGENEMKVYCSEKCMEIDG